MGSVEAGRRQYDEAAVIGLDEFTDDAPTITIPNTKSIESSVFALQVNGQSMENERIFDGDYIFVEKFRENEQPKQNEMIVAMYLPPDIEPHDDWDASLDGPTVKYYFQIEENGELLYRLSQRKDIRESRHTIITRKIQLIGRVVGVYRSVGKS